MRPLLILAMIPLAGCVPATDVISSTPQQITICTGPGRAPAQQAEAMAIRHCAGRGLVPRAVMQSACPTVNGLPATRYECVRG